MTPPNSVREEDAHVLHSSLGGTNIPSKFLCLLHLGLDESYMYDIQFLYSQLIILVAITDVTLLSSALKYIFVRLVRRDSYKNPSIHYARLLQLHFTFVLFYTSRSLSGAQILITYSFVFFK